MSTDNRPESSRAQQEAWVLSTMSRALAYARSLLRDRSLADDVVHDCYLRLLRKAEVYDLGRDGTKLLFRSITNACIDRNTRERVHLSLDRELTNETERSNAGVVDRNREGPLQAVVRKELEEAVADGLAGLPLGQRAALELKSLGYSIQEIAEALDTNPGNARVLVHRARKGLAENLSGYLGSERDD